MILILAFCRVLHHPLPRTEHFVFRFNAEEMISINPLILLHCQVPDIPQGGPWGCLSVLKIFQVFRLPLKWVCICDTVWRKKSFELTNNVVVLTEARTRQFGIVDLWRQLQPEYQYQSVPQEPQDFEVPWCQWNCRLGSSQLTVAAAVASRNFVGKMIRYFKPRHRNRTASLAGKQSLGCSLRFF